MAPMPSIRASVVALFALVTALTATTGTRAQQDSSRTHVAPPPVGGRLAQAVLLGGPPLTEADIPADLSSADRLRLLAFLERRDVFQSQLHATGATGQQRRLERDIASVVERTGVEQEAAAIAADAQPIEESPTRAAQEAAWAERVLRERPSSPAAPYLYAWLAARYRQVFEQLPGDDRPALERQARKYKTMLDRVRAADDPIFPLLANDLDGLPSLGTGIGRHPQQYLPDT